MVLSNKEWVQRAEVGLKLWHCRRNHITFHRIGPFTYDCKWDMWDLFFSCDKCHRNWSQWSPISSGIARCLSQKLGSTVRESSQKWDPLYPILLRSGRGSV